MTFLGNESNMPGPYGLLSLPESRQSRPSRKVREHRTLTTAQSQPVIHNRWETVMEASTHVAARKAPWNKGKLVGQKAPLKLKDIWAIRVRLQIGHRTRE